jgi:molecular chaperone GrpE
MTKQSPEKNAPQFEPQDDAEAAADAVREACHEGPAEDGSDLAAELAAQRDRTLRLQAEMENLRTRTAREIADQSRYGAIHLIRDLLPVLDNIDRAIEAAEKSGEATTLLEGFKLVRQQLVTLLEQHQCVPIEALGAEFNPEFHSAILTQPSDQQPANRVLMETQVGYTLHDRVVRPSQVIISSGPADQPT